MFKSKNIVSVSFNSPEFAYRSGVLDGINGDPDISEKIDGEYFQRKYKEGLQVGKAIMQAKQSEWARWFRRH